ncbi:MAG: hypothetical protein KatS3mg025_0040 [Bacteroidia bacterium]|nr:MAG: hypothetical protein KatS3mg025_0040 [Bacteroidia bacterium]
MRGCRIPGGVKVQLDKVPPWNPEEELRLRGQLAQVVGPAVGPPVEGGEAIQRLLSLLQLLDPKGKIATVASLFEGFLWSVGSVHRHKKGHLQLNWARTEFALEEKPISEKWEDFLDYVSRIIEAISPSYSLEKLERVTVEWVYYFPTEESPFTKFQPSLIKELPKPLRWSYEVLADPDRMERLLVSVRDFYEAASPPFGQLMAVYTGPKVPIKHIGEWIHTARNSAQELINRIFASDFPLAL